MSNETQDKWDNILDPDLLRTNLTAASLYIAAFEILKGAIIDRIRDFFSRWDGDSFGPSDEYRSEVLVRNRSPLYASLDWLCEMGVVNEEAVEIFDQIKSMRNRLAHEMPDFLFKGADEVFINNFREMVALLDQVETWWILEFEVPINPQYDGQDIDAGDVYPGNVMLLQMMLDVALGSDEENYKYYRILKEMRGFTIRNNKT